MEFYEIIPSITALACLFQVNSVHEYCEIPRPSFNTSTSLPIAQLKEGIDDTFRSIGRLLEQLSTAAAREVMTANPMAENEGPIRDAARAPEASSICLAAEEIGGRLPPLMSTLQSGDIALQRLDHILQLIEMTEAAGLNRVDSNRFFAMIAAQLNQTCDDLTSSCGRFIEEIGRLARLIDPLANSASMTSHIDRAAQRRTKADAVSAPVPALAVEASACEETQLVSGADRAHHDGWANIASKIATLAGDVQDLRVKAEALSDLSGRWTLEMPNVHDGRKISKANPQTPSLSPTPGDALVQDSDTIDALSRRMFALYTMNSERDLHKRHFFLDIDSSDISAISLFDDIASGDGESPCGVLF